MKKIIICLFSGLLLFGSAPFAIAKEPPAKETSDKDKVEIVMEWGEQMNAREDMPLISIKGKDHAIYPYKEPLRAAYLFNPKDDLVKQPCYTNAPVVGCWNDISDVEKMFLQDPNWIPNTEKCDIIISLPANIPIYVHDSRTIPLNTSWYTVSQEKLTLYQVSFESKHHKVKSKHEVKGDWTITGKELESRNLNSFVKEFYNTFTIFGLIHVYDNYWVDSKYITCE